VTDHRPKKEDPNRVRITVGGNLIDYPFELTTRTADMVSSKILWNSVISAKDARFTGADIKNMYLKTPVDQYEYMKMPLTLFPADIIEYYKLMDKALDGYAYMEIGKGMYGLPQAGVLANKILKERLARHGYFEQPHTPGLWKHVSRPIWFTYAYVWMILESSILDVSTFNTYTMRYKRKCMKLLKIWKVTSIVTLP